MKSNQYHPDFLGECRLGTYYVSPFHSLKTDENYRTIWLNLETPKELFKQTEISAYTFPIIRKSLGKKEDFGLFLNDKVLILFKLFEKYNLPIPQIINIILNPSILGQDNQELISQIQHLTEQMSLKEKKELIKFGQLVQNLRKESLTKLLNEKKYTLLFGSLNNEEKLENQIITETTPEVKKIKVTEREIEECFGNIILSPEIFDKVFSALGLKNILSNPPELPNSGGAIFIDMGGTGKSLVKDALKCFWKKIGGECIEKNGIAEFKEGTNYATLISSWYFGNKGEEQNSKYDKVGLFNYAIKNRVPSLLIIDEADRFVKDEDDKAAELIITEFKKYLNPRTSSGLGVVGYVLTVFIANVDEKNLNPQLRQGDSRLEAIYFGPPTNTEDWVELINLYFKNNKLRFKDRTKEKDELLANLILLHNNSVYHEKYQIPPRQFKSFCSKYLSNFYTEEKKNMDGENRIKKIFNSLYSKQENKNIEIEYDVFLKHFIEELLLNEIRLAGLNINEFRQKYFEFVSLIDENNNSQENKKNPQECENFMKIYLDNDTQRIIGATEYWQLFGSYKNISARDARILYRVLVKKYDPNGNNFIKFEGKKYSDEICIELVNLIIRKIHQTKKSFDNLNQKFNQRDFDFQKFHNFYKKCSENKS